jgi:hypothetical protein
MSLLFELKNKINRTNAQVSALLMRFCVKIGLNSLNLFFQQGTSGRVKFSCEIYSGQEAFSA